VSVDGILSLRVSTMTVLILLPQTTGASLNAQYARALESAVELYIVSAYLTDWNTSIRLSSNCQKLRIIVGRDFGITRKLACRKVMQWLPANLKNRFMAAERIDGFHPKAVFWREKDGGMHALVGSSNLTSAAFSKNHEANIYLQLSAAQFAQAAAWVTGVESKCEVIDEDWLAGYDEAKPVPRRTNPKKAVSPSVLPLPDTHEVAELLRERRGKMAVFRKHQPGLMRLFRDCAQGRITNLQFYERLPNHWGWGLGNRFQAKGWERQGKASDFRALSQSLVCIVDAKDEDRDDLVAQEIDRLASLGVRSRTAFFTEMLCQWFPKLYPVMNKPVKEFRSAIGYEKLAGASEGAAYVYWAQCLRLALADREGYPAKNIAELDALIWLRYHQ